ncbi:MAG: hypothetical protein HQM02_07220 [Magnetococcales bacterium]|nr:hypothetical protein [Magnetococcales bacterium]
MPKLISLASLQWTPLLLLLLGAGAIGAAQGVATPTALLALPLALLGLNLLAAIVANATFRAQPALLVFHVALLGMVVLAGLGRLTYLKGWVELAHGEAFQGELTGVEKGWLHGGRLERVVFANEGFVKEYGPDWRGRKTSNPVRWLDDRGVWRRTVLGEENSLPLHGYRIYTSSNHGFAPVFVWRQAGRDRPVRGVVHLPAYPRYREQSNAWTIPGTDIAVLAMLLMEEPVVNAATGGIFPTVPRHRLRVTVQGETRDLLPGERFPLPRGGELQYVELGAWMGYRVFYEWSRSWLLATCLVAATSLSWHFWRKFAVNPVKL